MTTLEQPLPAGGPSREEVARIEVGHTTIARVTARVLLAFFASAIFVVPIVELAVARRQPASAWEHLARVPGEIRTYVVSAAVEDGAWSRLVSANRIVLSGMSGFERGLEDESVIGRALRPPAQVVMTRWLGAGNERVYPGLEGWLFYRPDVDYLTGRPFLDRTEIVRRVAAAPEWTTPPQPDPRPAIVQFKRDLEARGITLVVAPAPLKPGVHPEKLSADYGNGDAVLQNPSYAAFVDDLRRDGVLVFDPSNEFAAARRAAPQYLATDTHWRPEAMEAVAELLGAFIAAQVELPAVPDPAYRVERTEVTSTGDVARMLDLPEHATLFPPESVWLRRVLQRDGSPWRSTRDADVLLLGDSFTNIYSLESMGWGTSAGLAEQLSYTLARPVDRLVQNDQGSFATRAMLAADPKRLHGKRVVIYQFAARELAIGDWKVIRLPAR